MEGMLTQDRYVESLAADADGLLVAARAADPAAAVPACPGWTVVDLVWHLATEYRSWASILEEARTEEPLVESATRPEDDREVWALADESIGRIVAACRAADPDTPVWCDGDGGPSDVAGWVIRRMAHETAMHRLDAEQTAARAFRLDPVFAADGIDEFLTSIYPFRVQAGDAPGGSIHLHCTDTEGEWTIAADGSVTAGHAKGDAAMRGTAHDLLTAIWRRQPLDTLDVFGDTGLAARFVAATAHE